MTLRYLVDESGATTLGCLAEHIAGIENDKPVRALSSSERKRVYISLYQCHLPKMDDADIINFEENRKTIELADNAEAVMEFLPEEMDNESSSKRRGWAATFGNLATAVGERLRK